MAAIGSTARRRRRGLLALAVLCAGLGVGMGAGLARRDAEAVVGEEAMRAETDALAVAVGQARRVTARVDCERKLVGPGEVRVASAAILRGGLAAGEADVDGKLFARLGLLPAGASYADLLAGAVARDPVGFYDPSARRLYVPSFIPLAVQRPTLAHEIAHALQDQRLGLRRFLKVTADGRRGLSFDGQLARQALIEGDAAVLSMEAIEPRATFPPPLAIAEMVQRARESVSDACQRPEHPNPQPAPDAAAPPASSTPARFLCELLAFPYVEGFAFVARVRGLATWAAVDGIWARPPESTAQILHPRRYDRRQGPLELELPPLPLFLLGDRFRLARTDTLGEVVVRSWLAASGPAASARAGASAEIADRAATGWRGDRVAVYLPVAGDNGAGPDPLPDPPPRTGEGRLGGVTTPTGTGAITLTPTPTPTGTATGTPPPVPGAALAWLTAWDSEADADDFVQNATVRLAALAAAGGAAEIGLPIDAVDHPAIWRERTGDSVFAVERRGALVALLLGAPAAAVPSLGAMLEASSPARLERLRRSRATRRDSR